LIEKAVDKGDDFGAFVATSHDFVAVDELMLVGGDEETTSEFYSGTAFSFGDPFGVLLKEGVKFFSSGDFAPFKETIADEEDVFDEVVLKVDDASYLKGLLEGKGLAADLDEGGGELFFKGVEAAKVVGGGVDDALLFVGPTAFAGAGTGSHGAFDFGFPVFVFSPAGQAEFVGEAAGEFDGFSGGIPGKVQVGREVNICFKDVAVDFDPMGRFVFF